jgi:hypothetical protein
MVPQQGVSKWKEINWVHPAFGARIYMKHLFCKKLANTMPMLCMPRILHLRGGYKPCATHCKIRLRGPRNRQRSVLL